MDYDNDEHHNNNESQEEKRRSWLTPMLLGIIIGILLVSIAMPNVFEMVESKNSQSNNDTNNDNNTTENSNNNTEQWANDQTSSETSYVNVDVTTQITDVVEKVSPAVVGVTNIQLQADFWEQQNSNQVGTGSGAIYKIEDGYAYIVTNHHVIEGADEVEIVLSDDVSIEADILGSDVFTDLAVLRMEDTEVDQTIEMGSSDQLKVGEPAIAIGNPLGHMFSGSVTQGVISGTQRTIPVDINQDGRSDWQAEVIQTDAAINPGNSGGALINIEGQLIGINSMKINEASVEGIGFAIPIDAARPIIEELETSGQVTRAYLGVEIYSLEEVPTVEWDRTLNLPEDIEGGIYVWSIEPLSPADKGGMKRLDVITELDGEAVMDTIDLRKVLYQEKEVGDELEITFYRDGEKETTTVTLEEQQ